EAVIDQIVLSKETEKERIAAGVEQGLKLGNGEVIISIIKDAGFSIPDK
ncbi:MAG: hypothetical protein COX78_01930, partial [Candidatus Levybacteria bacterium CG_4_10_14_0_2_um_filter_35_8]